MKYSFEQIKSMLGTAVVCDALDSLGYTKQSPRIELRAMTGIPRLVGRCKTTRWVELECDDPGTYEKELQAVDSCQPNDILIAAAGGSTKSGIWGELLSTAARNRQCAGALVDGAVRDIAKMTAMGFSVFARTTCPYDSMNRQKVTHYDVPVKIDGVTFSPGDIVLADEDGVVVVPQAVEAEALDQAWKKIQAEDVTRDAIRAGMKATDAYKKYGVL